MRKYNWAIMAVLLTGFWGCSSDNDDNNTPSGETDIPIGMSADNMGGFTSRAVVNTADDMKKGPFAVYGYKVKDKVESVIFPHQEVSWSEGKWTYSPAKYWDKLASMYYFFAYYPAALNTSNLQIADKKLTIQGINSYIKVGQFDPLLLEDGADDPDACEKDIQGTQAYSADVLLSSSKGTPAEYIANDGTVDFTFSHLQSQLVFRVEYPDYEDDTETFYITGIDVNLLPGSSAQWKMEYSSTGNTYTYRKNTSSDYTASPELGNASVYALSLTGATPVYPAIATTEPHFVSRTLLVPYTLTENLKLKVYYIRADKDAMTVDKESKTVTVGDALKGSADQSDWIEALVGDDPVTAFEAGKIYTITIKFNKPTGGVAIEVVSVAVSDWATGEEKSQEFYNW